MKNYPDGRVFQLFVWQKRENGEMVLEDVRQQSIREIARFVDFTTGKQGWDEAEVKFELLVAVKLADEQKPLLDIGTWQVKWGIPTGKRVPRLCVELPELGLRDLVDWATL